MRLQPWRLSTPTQFVDDEDAFWDALSERVHRFDLDAPDRVEAHEQCDRRLVQAIDLVVCPMLGPHGYGDELWFENLDFFGDGVRQLSFRWSDVPPALVNQLQSLLAGEHEQFCILCKFHTDGVERGDLVGLLGLFHGYVLATAGLEVAIGSAITH